MNRYLRDFLCCMAGATVALIICHQQPQGDAVETTEITATTDTITAIAPQPIAVSGLPTVKYLPLYHFPDVTKKVHDRADQDCEGKPSSSYKQIKLHCESVTFSEADTPRQISRFDSAYLDSVAVVVPIERKVYADSTYRAVITGAWVSLDTITVYSRATTVARTIRATAPRWGIGLTAGYGLTPHGLQPYLGIGITYTICHL